MSETSTVTYEVSRVLDDRDYAEYARRFAAVLEGAGKLNEEEKTKRLNIAAAFLQEGFGQLGENARKQILSLIWPALQDDITLNNEVDKGRILKAAESALGLSSWQNRLGEKRPEGLNLGPAW